MTVSIRSILSAALSVSALATASMAALPAHAEGLYIGGNVASPDWRSPVNGLAGKDHNAAVNLYGGYTLNSNLALELGYMTLGHQNGDLGEVRGHGGYLDVVGTLPLGMSNFSLLGRLGYDRASIMTDAGSDNGGGLNFGAGLQYDLSRNVALRAEVTRYRFGTFGTTTVNDQYSVGVKYGF